MMLRAAGLAACMLVAGAGAAPGAPFARAVVVSPSDCVTPANIVAEEAAAPTGETYLRVQHIGDPGTAERRGEIANEVTWHVGALTGFDARGIPGAQRGFRNEGLPVGTSAFQLSCDEAGFLINTWQFSHREPVLGAGPSVSVWRDLAAPLPAFAGGAGIVLEAQLRAPWVLNQRPPVEAGTAQLSFGFYARDMVSGKYIGQVVQVFDNRPPGAGGVEFASYDGVVNFVSSPAARVDFHGLPVRFATVAPGDPQIQYQAPWSEARRYRIIVTHANFAAALETLRAQRQPELSPRPEDYAIASFGIFGEVFPGTGDDDNVSFAASAKGLTLRTMPLPALPAR